jgi:hypothetical protein
MASCPYLVETTTDWLWLYPYGAFCRHPDGRIRVPAPATLAARCTGDGFHECDGYAALADAAADEGDHDGG